MIQFVELFTRITMMTLRSPRVMFALMGIATFVGILLSSTYSNIERFEMDFSNIVKSKQSMKNWMGFAAYLNQDCFSSAFFANIVSLPLFLPVFKREFSSGLYSVHMYYFGNWFCKLVTMGFYPVMLMSIIFPFLDLTDVSF
jgi:hypothetical protein